MTKYSSAADYHPNAPKTIQGNAALLDKNEGNPPPKNPSNSIPVYDPAKETPTEYDRRRMIYMPNPNSRKAEDGLENDYTKNNTAGFVKGAKISGGGGNCGCVISPAPGLGLSAYQDPSLIEGKLPHRQEGGI